MVRPAAPGSIHPDPSLPLALRIQGKWRMNIDKVPDSALTPEFLKLKKDGKGESMLITYTVTDTEFTLEAYVPGGIRTDRFSYEILREQGENMTLKRFDKSGVAQEVHLAMKEDWLIIGMGDGRVPLQRVSLLGQTP